MYKQACSQEFAMGERGVWKLETTSNDLDPDFDQSSIRLSRFFCQNFGDFQKKVFTEIETVFFLKFS